MRRDLAARKVWGTGSVWVAGSEPEPAPVQATVVQVVHVHYYVPLPAERPQAVPAAPQRAAIAGTTEGSK